MRYAGDFAVHDADRLEVLWRACSGAAHGDAWAVLSLQEKEASDPADGVVTIQLTASILALSLVTDEVVDLLEMAFGLLDHRDQTAAALAGGS
ncbi:hypothetical protein Afe04nite_20690 [Asanoa ferruginea]|uniref:hypothetical protein n=1 Tax=Asanoa ferruginea TaxID=53367 RepID=UPI000E284C0F|nr:hypothetical protein [Asanoa ferruginea]GIF47530.1 hypothetical protein Afe04nite_20690 [Asanoa ferruginea]